MGKETVALVCGSRASGVPVFEVASSKSAPTMRCFATFDFQMCFARRRRANFCQPCAPAALPRLPVGSSGSTKHRKTQHFAHFLSFISLTDGGCSTVHIVGNLTSKLPLTKCISDDSYTLEQLQHSFSTTVAHLSNSNLHFRRQLHT